MCDLSKLSVPKLISGSTGAFVNPRNRHAMNRVESIIFAGAEIYVGLSLIKPLQLTIRWTYISTF